MTKQMTKIATMLVLAIGLMASVATAQNKDGGFAPVGIYTGTETKEGTCDPMTGICHGNTFVLTSFGEWETYHLTASIDYTVGINPNSFNITGGEWTLIVLRDDKYTGTLYGEVQSGSVNLTVNNKGEAISKQAQMSLNSTGGMGLFKGKSGEDISGIYEATTDLRSKETQGRANFGF